MQGNNFSAAQIKAITAAGLDVKILSEKKVKCESAVPGKPADSLGPVTAIPTKKQDAARKRLLDKQSELKKEETIFERERVLESLKSRTQRTVDHQRQGTHGDDNEMNNMKKDAEKSVKRMNDRMGADAAGKRSERDVKRRFPKNEEVEYVEEERARVTQNGNIYIVGFVWLGKYMIIKLFFPEVKRPSRKEAQYALDKIYPGAKIQRFDQAPYNPSEPMLYMGVQEETEIQG